MAQQSLVPKNGAITYGTYVADFASFDIDGAQAVDVVTPYGSNVSSKNVGSNTADFVFTIGAFALAHAANTPPQIGVTAANGAPQWASGGVAATFTLDTGVSEACNVVTQRFRISHARMRGFVPFAITGKNAGDVTEVWAVS